MANTVIQLRHSTLTGNVPSTLANGEISINNRDGKFFYSTPAGAIITHYPYPGPAGLNQEVQFNDSGVLGSDSGLTYNKTTDVLTVVGGAIVDGVNVAPQIQSAYNHANAAFNQANTGGGGADQFARNTANAAYATANTKDFTFYQDTAPSTANSRDAWIDTDTGVLYKNFGNVTNPVWVETGPTGFSNVSGALAGDLVVSGNITPLTDNVYSLGSASYRFKDVFVGPGSVNIDGLVLSNVNGKLIINGASDLVLPGTQVPSTLSISNHANSAFVSANGTAIAANTPSHVANSAAIYANGAFTKANNALANTSGTLAGNLNITGIVTISNTTIIASNNSTQSALQINGYAPKGGAGFHDFLSVTNQGGGTNPNKYFRTNNTGGFEIINSAYTTAIFVLSDSGELSINGNFNAAAKGISKAALPTGSVLQVSWNNLAGSYTATSATNVDFTGFSATFTPLYSSSKVLIIVSAGVNFICDGIVYIKRNGTIIKDTWFGSSRQDDQFDYPQATQTYLDSPNTTSAITYQLGGRATGCGNIIRFGSSDNSSSILFMEIAA
jgi:hypothetical protein